MCGIAGIAYINNQKKVDQSELKLMADLMRHRGPDGEGFLVDGSVGFGHRRLSIIDLSESGRQPMTTVDQKIWTTFNGEIYNFKELKKELVDQYQFQSSSDTEILLHGYRSWGEGLLQRIRGMFAFGIYDQDKQQLLLAVDHTGQKPLYYYFDKQQQKFYFSSEIRSILEVSKVPRKINMKALHLYFVHNWRHIPHPHTIIEGVYKLAPATYLVFDLKKGEYQIKNYWRPDFSKNNVSEKKLIDDYRAMVKECVDLVGVSDVPIAVSLSGGLDSSTIMAFTEPGKRTYSLGFNESDPELQRARKIAKKYQANSKEIIFDKESLGDIDKLIQLHGEPLNLLPVLHFYKICQAAGKDVKVLVGGNGADEIFYGYDGTARLRRLSLIYNLTRFIPRSVFRQLTKINWRFGLFAAGQDEFKGEFYRRQGAHLRNNLYQEQVKDQLKEVNEGSLIDYYNSQCNSPHLIEKGYYSGLMSENQHSLTINADLAGMANSVEVRSPFLDHKMIEFASSLLPRFKSGSWWGQKRNKYIMRKSMEGILPGDIIYASKMGLGYNIKIGRLINADWKEAVDHVLLKTLPRTNIFNMEFIKIKLDEHRQERRDNSALLWGLYIFGVWYKQNI